MQHQADKIIRYLNSIEGPVDKSNAFISAGSSVQRSRMMCPLSADVSPLAGKVSP
jgi:hypothetical protein